MGIKFLRLILSSGMTLIAIRIWFTSAGFIYFFRYGSFDSSKTAYYLIFAGSTDWRAFSSFLPSIPVRKVSISNPAFHTSLNLASLMGIPSKMNSGETYFNERFASISFLNLPISRDLMSFSCCSVVNLHSLQWWVASFSSREVESISNTSSRLLGKKLY